MVEIANNEMSTRRKVKRTQLGRHKGYRKVGAMPDSLSDIEEGEEEGVEDFLQKPSNELFHSRAFALQHYGNSPTNVSEIDNFPLLQANDDHDAVDDAVTTQSAAKASDKGHPAGSFTTKAGIARKSMKVKRFFKGKTATTTDDGNLKEIQSEDTRNELFAVNDPFNYVEMDSMVAPESADASHDVAFSHATISETNPKEDSRIPHHEGIKDTNGTDIGSTVPSDQLDLVNCDGKTPIIDFTQTDEAGVSVSVEGVDCDGMNRVNEFLQTDEAGFPSPMNDVEFDEQNSIDEFKEAGSVDIPSAPAAYKCDESQKGVLNRAKRSHRSKDETETVSRFATSARRFLVYRLSTVTNHKLHPPPVGVSSEKQSIGGYHPKFDPPKEDVCDVNHATKTPIIGSQDGTQSPHCPDMNNTDALQLEDETIADILEIVSQSTATCIPPAGSQDGTQSLNCHDEVIPGMMDNVATATGIPSVGSQDRTEGLNLGDEIMPYMLDQVSESNAVQISSIASPVFIPSAKCPDETDPNNLEEVSESVSTKCQKASIENVTDLKMIRHWDNSVGQKQDIAKISDPPKQDVCDVNHATKTSIIGSQDGTQSPHCPDMNNTDTLQLEDETIADILEIVSQSSAMCIPSAGSQDGTQSLNCHDEVIPGMMDNVATATGIPSAGSQDGTEGLNLGDEIMPYMLDQVSESNAVQISSIASPVFNNLEEVSESVSTKLQKASLGYHLPDYSEASTLSLDADMDVTSASLMSLEAAKDELSEASTPESKEKKRVDLNGKDCIQFLPEEESASTLTLHVDHYDSTVIQLLMKELLNNDTVTDLKIIHRWDDSVEQKGDIAKISDPPKEDVCDVNHATKTPIIGSQDGTQSPHCPDMNNTDALQLEDETIADILEIVSQSTATCTPSAGSQDGTQSLNCHNEAIPGMMDNVATATGIPSAGSQDGTEGLNLGDEIMPYMLDQVSESNALQIPSITSPVFIPSANCPDEINQTSLEEVSESVSTKSQKASLGNYLRDYSEASTLTLDADIDVTSASLMFQEAFKDELSETSTPESKEKKWVDQNRNNGIQFLPEEELAPTLTLYVDHYDSTAFRLLVKDLLNNENVTDLKITRRWDDSVGQKRDMAEISVLFRAIRSLPHLEKLQLENFDSQDLDNISSHSWQNPSLEEMHLHVVKGAVSPPLLKIISQMPALKVLVLEMNETFPIYIVLESTTLESLTIVANNYKIENVNLMEALQDLRTNKSLRKLVLEPPIDMRSFKYLAYSLRDNIRLEKLKVHVLPGDVHESRGAANELVRVLQNNSSLRKLRNLNYTNVRLSQKSCTLLLTALAGNTVFEDFRFCDEEPAFYDQKRRFLKRNKVDQWSVLPDIFDFMTKDTRTAQSKEKGLLGSLVHDYASIGDSIRAAGRSISTRGAFIALGIEDSAKMALGTCQ